MHEIPISLKDYETLAARYGIEFVADRFLVGRDASHCKHESIEPTLVHTGQLGSGLHAYAIWEKCRHCGIEKLGHEFTEYHRPRSAEPPW